MFGTDVGFLPVTTEEKEIFYISKTENNDGFYGPVGIMPIGFFYTKGYAPPFEP